MDADGTKAGFDLTMLRAVRAAVTVPVIASGGAGAVEHFAPAVEAGADAVLAASVFHFGELTIGQVKAAMAAEGIVVRMSLRTGSDAIAARLKRDANGLFTAVAQERGTGEVLMVAWMDDDALARTLETRKAHLLLALARRAVGQGRDVGAHAVRALGAAGLRRRHRAARGRSGRRGLPHRRSHLLRRRRCCSAPES